MLQAEFKILVVLRPKLRTHPKLACRTDFANLEGSFRRRLHVHMQIDDISSKDDKRANYLPYPKSTLSPQIIPTDLTSFKSRGATKVQKALHQQMTELREKYARVINEFNWNKLVYEAHFNFEPVLGETYYLYQIKGQFRLTLIGPGEWSHKYIGSFRLDSDGRWNVIEVAEGFDLGEFLESEGKT